MSPEPITRKKRAAADSVPAPDGDHRKRRRNRTTQSCLNCHTSKRMCDRKRPACARCTQLGLTGLCVYEVDDPNQRPDSQDESARLIKRVAELEGVIRELKNKPHPRWVQSGSIPGEEFEKWHSRSQNRASDDTSSGDSSPLSAPSPPSSVSSSDKVEGANASPVPQLINAYPSPTLLSHLDTKSTLSSNSTYFSSSPFSTPSPSTMTPTDEFTQPQVTIAGQADMQHEFDLASMFMSYPGLIGSQENMYDPLPKDDHQPHEESCFMKPQHQGEHCGCLHESASYNVVLELSLRLRKAADVLARSPSHRSGSNCLLTQRIAQLDAFTTNTLGNISTPIEDTSSPLTSDAQHAMSSHMMHPGAAYGSSNTNNFPMSTISPQSLHSLRSWDMMPTMDSSISCDDSFMSWEPPRRG